MNQGHWSKENAFACVHVKDGGVIGLALANDEMVASSVPMSYVTARVGDQWADAGGTSWDAVALTGLDQPRKQFVLVGPGGEVYVTGSGDRHEEQIADASCSPKTLGLIRDAVTLENTVFACGMKRQVYRRDVDGRWHCISPAMAGGQGVHGFEAIDGFSATDLYVVGWGGEIWHSDGQAWQQCDSPVDDVLVDVCCGGDGLVRAISSGGTLVTGRRDVWSAQPVDPAAAMTALCWFQGRLYAASTRNIFVQAPDGRFETILIGPDHPGTCGRLSTNGTVLVSAGDRDVFACDGHTWTRVD